MTTYVCPTCGRTYKSPVQLLDPPTCSGVGTNRRPKHSPKLMQPKAAVSNREQEKQPS